MTMAIPNYHFNIQDDIILFRINEGDYSGLFFGIDPPKLDDDGNLKISLSYIDPIEPGSNEFWEFTDHHMPDILDDFIDLMITNEQYQLKGENE